MDKLLYVVMSGAKSAMHRQATNNNNLANLSTTGFREDLDATRSYEMPAVDIPSRIYSTVYQNGINGKAGEIINTGRDLDIAIRGEGFIAVQSPDGSETYTRSGNLKINPNGILETADFLPVLGNSGPITISPYESLTIDTDGTITMVPLGAADGTTVVVDRIKLVNPDTRELIRNSDGTLGLPPKLTETITLEMVDGVLQSTDHSSVESTPDLPADAAVQLISKSLESSNVDPAKAMINMVELARLFEMQIKLMKNAEQNDEALSRLLN